jgi:hypothetical protein
VKNSIKLKHYCQEGTKPGGQPTLFFEVGLEVQDVRSEYRDSYRTCFQAEWLEESDLCWTPDMVNQISLDVLEEIHPLSEFDWPVWGDSKILHHITHHFHPVIWKNSALQMYSRARENKEDFLLRCQDRVLGDWLAEQKQFWDIFVHRFLDLENRLIQEIQGDHKEDEKSSSVRLERVRDLLFSVRESLWNFRDGWQLQYVPSLDWDKEAVPTIQIRLDSLKQDLVSTSKKINENHQKRAGQIERHEVAVTYAQLEIVSRGVMWNSLAPAIQKEPKSYE